MFGKNESNKVRTLIISKKFPPESMGGAHRWDQLARNFPEEIEPHVVCTPPILPLGKFDRSSYLYKKETVDGLPVTRLWAYQPSDGDWTGLGRILYLATFTLLTSLYVLLYWWKYDCIATFIGPTSILLPGFVGRLFGRSWVIDIDDMWIDNAADLGFIPQDSAIFKIVNKIERWGFKMSDAVIVISSTMVDQYTKKHDVDRDIFSIIPNGVDTTIFKQNDRDAVNKSRIVYTGKLGQAQAFEPFIRGFAQINDDHELWIVGAGDRRNELEMLTKQLNITNRVSFTGPVERAEIPQILQSAAVALVPLKTSYQLDYARPTKLVEAMATGTPYIASQVSEIEAVTTVSGAGKAVENNPESVAVAMQELLTDEGHRARIGYQGTEFVAKNHQWDVLGAQAGDVILAATSQ